MFFSFGNLAGNLPWDNHGVEVLFRPGPERTGGGGGPANLDLSKNQRVCNITTSSEGAAPPIRKLCCMLGRLCLPSRLRFHIKESEPYGRVSLCSCISGGKLGGHYLCPRFSKLSALKHSYLSTVWIKGKKDLI